MDFWVAQQQARLKSFRLAAMLALAVLCIIAAIYLPMAWWAGMQAPASTFPLWHGGLFLKTCLGVLAFIAVNSLIKMRQISKGGGRRVAVRLGGRLVTRGTGNVAERRLLNVTEEMAIAAGMPAPLVFIQDKELGLNAFAAGLSLNDSVVCVTRGLLKALTRDELQGVIGHEISHIVNGDSRLNLKLIGLLHGIQALMVLAAYLTAWVGDKCDPWGKLVDGMRVIILVALGGLLLGGKIVGGFMLVTSYSGILLFIAGFIGYLFGNIIQAAVSREREYLADASAAQFTRHPLGLASALQKLLNRGSRVRHPGAAATSHLFFADIHSSQHDRFFAWLLATHPPLAERIARLGGEPKGPDPAGEGHEYDEQETEALDWASALIPAAGLTPAQSLLAGLPLDLRQEAEQPAGAAGLVGGLLFSAQADVRQRQEALLPPASRPAAARLYQWMAGQPENGVQYRLTWLDLALPCLHEMPDPERRRLLGLAEALIRADDVVSIDEFAFYSLLRGSLWPPAARGKALGGRLHPERLDRGISLLLGLMSRAGGGEAGAVKAAYQAALACSPARLPQPFPSREDLSPAAIFQALEHLAFTAPAYRRKILSACSVAVQRGGQTTPAGRELIRAYAQSLNYPLPL